VFAKGAARRGKRQAIREPPHPRENTTMHSGFRAALLALTVAFAGVGLSSAAHADSGTISFRVLKGGWVIGASGGSGTLVFHGQRYPISIGGVSAGFVFGASETFFHGSVSHIGSPSDVAGIYGAAGAGAAVGAGAQFITLTNEKGAILTLTGRQIGLQINADLSGLSISVR
jgi:hypothetical protein